MSNQALLAQPLAREVRACSSLPAVSSVARPVILLVDDEPLIREVLGLLLRAEGFTVWAAASGEEALEIYRAHQTDIALVLSDVQMPGLDGRATLEALRELNPAVRCCFLSGGGRQTMEALLEEGAIWVFPKPAPVEQIGRILWILTTGTGPRQ